eukprot:gene1638-2447_t
MREKEVPAWERDGREMKSLPSMTTKDRSRSKPHAAPAARRGSAKPALNSSSGCCSSTRSETPPNPPKQQHRRPPHRRAADSVKSSVWTCFRVRPPSKYEADGDVVRCDAVEAALYVPSPAAKCNATTGIRHPGAGYKADAAFGPTASQGDLNMALCMEIVPIAFGGGTAAVVCTGGRLSGKTSMLFACPGELPDPYAVPVPSGPGWSSSSTGAHGAVAKQVSAALGGAAPRPEVVHTHFGGLVPAFMSDVVKRVADLSVYNITVAVSLLQVTAGDQIVDVLGAAGGDPPAVHVGAEGAAVLQNASERPIERASDFADLWREVRGSVASDGATLCVVTLTRVDDRNGGVSAGRIVFADLPSPEAGKHARTTVSVVNRVVCSAASMGPADDVSHAFIPWRESKATRILQSVLSGPGVVAYAPPRIFVVAMVNPCADHAHDALTTAGFVAAVAKAKAAVEVKSDADRIEELKDVSRRLQSRLAAVTATQTERLAEAQQELVKLRREAALLKAAGGSQPAEPRRKSSPSLPAAAADEATGNPAKPQHPPSVAKILQVLAHHKVVKPDAGAGAASVLGQLVSQVIARERAVSRARRAGPHPAAAGPSPLLLLSPQKWKAVCEDLLAADPRIKPATDHRSLDQPFHVLESPDPEAFAAWWNHPPSTPPPPPAPASPSPAPSRTPKPSPPKPSGHPKVFRPASHAEQWADTSRGGNPPPPAGPPAVGEAWCREAKPVLPAAGREAAGVPAQGSPPVDPPRTTSGWAAGPDHSEFRVAKPPPPLDASAASRPEPSVQSRVAKPPPPLDAPVSNAGGHHQYAGGATGPDRFLLAASHSESRVAKPPPPLDLQMGGAGVDRFAVGRSRRGSNASSAASASTDADPDASISAELQQALGSVTEALSSFAAPSSDARRRPSHGAGEGAPPAARQPASRGSTPDCTPAGTPNATRQAAARDEM